MRFTPRIPPDWSPDPDLDSTFAEDHLSSTLTAAGGVMPWDKVQHHDDCPASKPWAVVNTDTGDVMGCHATEADADAQLAALNANTDEEYAVTDTTTEVPARADDISPDGEPWYGILAPEGVISGDDRRFEEGSLTWRDLPLPLMYQEATAIGHDGAVRVARIDSIERDEATYDHPMVRATGVWDTSEVAQEAKRQIESGMLRGVSVEADEYVAELVDENGDPIDWEDMLFFSADEQPGRIIESATQARIAGATLVSVPAFHQSYVANGVRDPGATEPGQAEETVDFATPPTPPPPGGGDGEEDNPYADLSDQQLVDAYQQAVADDTDEVDDLRAEVDDRGLDAAAAADGEVQPKEEAVPASAWTLVASAAVEVARNYSDPFLDGPTAMTIDPDGHVYGHLALWGECHIGRDGTCVMPPHSDAGYLYFATGLIDTDSGPVPVGQITMDTGHAATHLSHIPAAAHYDNTGCAVADIAVGEDAHGIWYSGMIRPGTTETQIRNLRAGGALSGDWRDVRGNLELVAALAVNVPGYPVPRLSLAASAGRQMSLVAAGIVGPSTVAWRTHGGREEAAIVRAVLAALDRRDRVTAARRRIGRDRASRIAAAVRAVRGA